MRTLLKYCFPVFIIAIFTSCTNDFVHVKGTQLFVGEKPYTFVGTNYWYGVNLASKGSGGDRARLLRELELMKSLGITNLRIMAGTEGPDNEPYRVIPSMQPSPGAYNPDQEDALDFLLSEMSKRNMRAVVCFSNFWNWSGGIPQYLVWSGAADSIPYPPPHPGGNWDVFQKFSASFYSNARAMQLLEDHIAHIINRKNTYTGRVYKEDPTIMAWELANEPRGINNIDAYRSWINKTAAYIKTLDEKHLVTTGSEGLTITTDTGNDPYLDHTSQHIDYVSVHLWVENWGVFDPATPEESIEKALSFAHDYIAHHIAIAKKLKKPMVLEEFGIGRDFGSHEPTSPTQYRDRYFKAILNQFHEEKSILAGVNFWGWAGEGRPRKPNEMWKVGDDFIGDPPHENQGWYSVYDSDTTTLSVIRAAAALSSSVK